MAQSRQGDAASRPQDSGNRQHRESGSGRTIGGCQRPIAEARALGANQERETRRSVRVNELVERDRWLARAQGHERETRRSDVGKTAGQSSIRANGTRRVAPIDVRIALR